MECNKCNDDPYDVEYVDVGIGSVPVALLWHCQECYEVIENGRNRKVVRLEFYFRWLRSWPSIISTNIKMLLHGPPFVTEEDDIPF